MKLEKIGQVPLKQKWFERKDSGDCLSHLSHQDYLEELSRKAARNEIDFTAQINVFINLFTK